MHISPRRCGSVLEGDMNERQAGKNSLEVAIVAGVVSAEAAFCGLSEDDVAALVRRGFADAMLLVRSGDGRVVTRADQVARVVGHIERRGSYVRDVTAVAIR